jgi:hypothetical protein
VKEGHKVRRNETLKYGGGGITEIERVGERETPGACARWSYMPKHFSSLPSALSSPQPPSTCSVDIWFAHMCTTCSVLHSLPSSDVCETVVCNS